MPSIQLVQPVGSVGRKFRNPKHSFQLRTRPYVLQPFLLAPVLPGETMKNLLLQSRVVSDPVKNPLIGWWKEYYVFYVKLRDLSVSATLQTMLLNPGTDVTALQTGVTTAALYAPAGGIRFASLCLEAVTREYFRDEGETWNNVLRDGLPLVQARPRGTDWLDSLMLGSTVPEQDPDDVSMQDAEKQRLTWEFMRAQKMTALSFEDFLRTFGVNGVEESQRPELVRYVREWTYPANTVDGSGAVNSALSWSIQERADKDRFFKEHGFLYGVTVARPKVYLSKQVGSAATFLNDAFVWMPAALRENPEATLKEFAELTGPIPTIDDTGTGSYWVDMKDLFLYGDQFLNFALTATDAGLVALPTATGAGKYVADADVDAMFKTGTSNYVREDGIVALSILGTAAETS